MADNPSLFQVVYKNTHRAIVHRFPFVIYYYIEDDAIIVIGVIHGSRHPRNWKQRLN